MRFMRTPIYITCGEGKKCIKYYTDKRNEHVDKNCTVDGLFGPRRHHGRFFKHDL